MNSSLLEGFCQQLCKVNFSKLLLTLNQLLTSHSVLQETGVYSQNLPFVYQRRTAENQDRGPVGKICRGQGGLEMWVVVGGQTWELNTMFHFQSQFITKV